MFRIFHFLGATLKLVKKKQVKLICIFHLTEYIPDIIISTCNQNENLLEQLFGVIVSL